MAETFAEWLQKHVKRWRTIQAFADAMNVRDSAVHAWLHRNIVPLPGTEDRLAEITGTPAAEIERMMNDTRKRVAAVRRQRAEERRQVPPKSLLGRKKLAAVPHRLYRTG